LPACFVCWQRADCAAGCVNKIPFCCATTLQNVQIYNVLQNTAQSAQKGKKLIA
jgi:hypothetical protein